MGERVLEGRQCSSVAGGRPAARRWLAQTCNRGLCLLFFRHARTNVDLGTWPRGRMPHPTPCYILHASPDSFPACPNSFPGSLQNNAAFCTPYPTSL